MRDQKAEKESKKPVQVTEGLMGNAAVWRQYRYFDDAL